MAFSQQSEIKLGNCSQHSFIVLKKYSLSHTSCTLSINTINWHDMAVDKSFCKLSGQVLKHLKN